MSNGTGGAAVVRALKALDVDVVFAIASIHNLAILEAIRDDPGIRVVKARHEQGAVHAADGYSRATGRLGVAIVSTGPGTANAAGGLFEAGFSSSSVLLITGQVESQYYGQGRGFIHEAERQLGMLETLTKRSWSVARAEDILDDVVDAGQLALAGRRGPAAVEIPVDFQYANVDQRAPRSRDRGRTRPDPTRLDAALELIASAKRPVIWAGGGVVASDASNALRELVDRACIPVITSTQGRGSMPENHELCLASTISPEIDSVLRSADVVIAIGTRFQYYASALWSVQPGDRLVHIDVDPSVIGRSYAVAASVVADAKLAIEAITRQLPTLHIDSDWVPHATQLARSARDRARESLGADHRRISDLIRKHLPDGGAIVCDSTVPAYRWGTSLLEVRQPRTALNPSSASIGPGLPLAIGAAIGRQETSVVIHGDGGIMLSIGELVVLAESDIPLIVLVFNDRGYGVLKGIQGATFDTGNEYVDLHTPDFVTLATSMGVQAERVGGVESFERVFEHAVAQKGPYVIEIDMHSLEPMHVDYGAQDFVSTRFLGGTRVVRDKITALDVV